MFHLNIETAVHIRLYTLLVTLQSYNGQGKKPKTKTSVSFNNLALQSQPNGWIYKMHASGCKTSSYAEAKKCPDPLAFRKNNQ